MLTAVLWFGGAVFILWSVNSYTSHFPHFVMKKQHARAADPKRGEAVRVRHADSMLVKKAAAKRASGSSKAENQRDPRKYSFVPVDAPLKVSRWPKL